MPNGQHAAPPEGQGPTPENTANLLEQIVDATLSDSRVSGKMNPTCLAALRRTLLASAPASPDKVRAAGNQENNPETA